MSIYQDIRDAIAADPALQTMQANGDTQGIADAISVGRTKYVTTIGGIGSVLRTLGPTDGAAFLDALDSIRGNPQHSPLKWAWTLIERGELDLGDPSVHTMLQSYAAGGVITQAAADALIASSQVDDPVTHTQVAKAIAGEA